MQGCHEVMEKQFNRLDLEKEENESEWCSDSGAKHAATTMMLEWLPRCCYVVMNGFGAGFYSMWEFFLGCSYAILMPRYGSNAFFNVSVIFPPLCHLPRNNFSLLKFSLLYLVIGHFSR